jgi:hypothetical protein
MMLITYADNDDFVDDYNDTDADEDYDDYCKI